MECQAGSEDFSENKQGQPAAEQWAFKPIFAFPSFLSASIPRKRLALP